jgi:hypothetical protein
MEGQGLSLALAWAQAGRSLPGQEVSGDAAWVEENGTKVRVAVLDGLGHGPEAHAASALALERLPQLRALSLEAAFQTLDQALLRSRGAALSMADLDLEAGHLRWAGVGNVEGVLLKGKDPGRLRERLLLQSGIVGCRLPSVRPREIPLEAGDCLLFHSDGIRQDVLQGLDWRLEIQTAADGLLQHYAKESDDALVWLGKLHAR